MTDRKRDPEYVWERTTERCMTLYPGNGFLLEGEALMPEEVAAFFGVEEEIYGKTSPVGILYEDRIYRAGIVREKGRARIAWGPELAGALAARHRELGDCENIRFYMMPRPMLGAILPGQSIPALDVFYMVPDGE